MSDEDAYRRLFESHPVAMAIWDPADGRILAINDAAEHQYGYSREEAIGLRVDRLVHPDDWARLRERLATMPPGHVSGDVYRHIRRDGSVIEVEMTGHELEFEGRPARFVMALDVTERRVLEEQLRQAQRMEAVGRLAGGIAHDFNNLLMVINGFSELLVEQLGEGEELDAAHQILSAGERAAALTRQLLDFAEPDRRATEVIDLGAAIKELRPTLERTAGPSVRLRVVVRGGRLSVRTDRGQLEQVLVQLVVNGRDAMAGDGRLDLVIEEAPADLAASIEAAHGAVLVSVSDTGPGIPEEDRERVFLPFFTTHEDRGSTGLGLAMVFALVRSAGGRVWVDRTVGRGTTIRLLFPRSG